MKKQFCFAASFLLLILSCCFATSVQAQTTCLSGTVIDSATRQVIPGAILHLDQTALGTGTNALGQFNWCKLPVGKQVIQISCIGYEVCQQTVEISASGNSPITIMLKSKSIQLREVAIEANDIGQSMSAILAEIGLLIVDTATGGLTLMTQKGLSAATRFKYIGDRPANEANTVQAKGFFLVDALVNYQTKHYGIGLSVENVFNVIWNQAQFDTESRLQNETMSVSELHYTPGTPTFIKGNLSYYF
jgi:hypothetical protein